MATASFDALNSATKYPSIDTYHKLDPSNGVLLDTVTQFPDGPVTLTEKIDGAGTRIIMRPDGDWLIGSREELLHARGDRIFNPVLGIVPALLPVAERLARQTRIDSARHFINKVTWVWYLEVYGASAKNPATRQYTGAGNTGIRLFDVAGFEEDVLSLTPEQIAGWREHGGQSFLSEDVLPEAAADAGVELTPRLGTVQARDLPQGIEEMLDFLNFYGLTTKARLDDQARGQAEGIVLRDPHRTVIAKAKFANYERTLRLRAMKPEETA